MDYEKKYKNALEWARQVKNGRIGFVLSEVEKVFPELQESEDERVRKELIDAIQGLWDNDALPLPLSVERKNEWLAWLEKLKVFAEHGDGLYYFGNNGFTYITTKTNENKL